VTREEIEKEGLPPSERGEGFLSPIPSRFNHSIKDWRCRQKERRVN
jgi:hypothetical protein